MYLLGVRVERSNERKWWRKISDIQNMMDYFRVLESRVRANLYMAFFIKSHLSFFGFDKSEEKKINNNKKNEEKYKLK